MSTNYEDEMDATDKIKRQKKLNNLLLLACVRGSIGDVSGLIELGAQVDSRDKAGISTMHFAAAHGRLEAVRVLWSKGAELEWEDKGGRTPLHLASLRGHSGVVTCLVENGAWLDSFDGVEDTPLHLAARSGHASTVAALLDFGAQRDVRNRRGLTPIGEALLGGHQEAAEKLREAGAEVHGGRDGAGVKGYSLLHLVAGAGQARGVRWLLDNGADANDASNAERLTPLHCAVMGGSAACVEALLKAGADPGINDAAGNPPSAYLEGDDEEGGKEGGKEVLGGDGDRSGVARVLENWAALGPSRPAARKAKQPTPPVQQPRAPPRNLRDAFREEAVDEQLRRVSRWADKDTLEAHVLLKDFNEETRKRVAEVNKIKRLINIHKGMCALHSDDDFQSDIRDPRVRAAIDKIRDKPALMAGYARDAAVQDVLAKLRRFHALSSANGFPKVNLEELIVPPSIDAQELDTKQSAIFRRMLDAQIAAAAAAAREDGEEAAKAAADAAASAAHRAAGGSGAPGSGGVEGAQSPAATGGGEAAAARSPTKEPGTLWEYWKLYWSEVRYMTMDNPEFWDLLKRKALQSVVMGMLAVLVVLLVHWFGPNLSERVQQIGPSTFNPMGQPDAPAGQANWAGQGGAGAMQGSGAGGAAAAAAAAGAGGGPVQAPQAFDEL